MELNKPTQEESKNLTSSLLSSLKQLPPLRAQPVPHLSLSNNHMGSRAPQPSLHSVPHARPALCLHLPLNSGHPLQYYTPAGQVRASPQTMACSSPSLLSLNPFTLNLQLFFAKFSFSSQTPSLDSYFSSYCSAAVRYPLSLLGPTTPPPLALLTSPIWHLSWLGKEKLSIPSLTKHTI